jgi:BlaI family transcriptional regulator, penicillinase repressor
MAKSTMRREAPRPSAPKPSAGELEILGVLWRRGPSTVHGVRDALARGESVAYTTVLKLLQIMAEKGLVNRVSPTRPHIYRAAMPEAKVKRRLVADLLDRVFEGSAMGLVMQALSARPASPEELQQLRALIDELEGERS